uniref:GGDEF domain-containing protein n=1 Tax=Parerythrobacter lutipelagi TaxID=1964208 RepID=UPI001375D3DD|nr:diguanylate cyclase [Parerythrobacter lutipelagi]
MARKSRTASWRGNFLIASVFLLALLLAGASWFATTTAFERENAEASRDHAFAVLGTADEIEIAALNAIRGERGYLLSDDPEFLRPLNDAKLRGRFLIEQLQELVADNPEQAASAKRVAAEFNALIFRVDRIVELHRRGDRAAAHKRVRNAEDRDAVETIVADLQRIERYENSRLAKRTLIAQKHGEANQNYQYLLSGVGIALMILAAFAVSAVRRAVAAEARVRSELRRRAMTDELTGLANRREFMASLDRAMASARRSRRPLSLAILDIDHFKRINDTFGHPAGDAVIRTVATTAVDLMRGQDTVGRIGGEEFAIVLPDCSSADAYAACERLRLAIRAADLEMETGEHVSVTLSTGIATFAPNDTAEQMIALADAALYQAKHGGRDRVLLAA